MLAYPAVCNGIRSGAPGVRVRIPRLSQPHLKTIGNLRVRSAPFATFMIRETVVLVAIGPVPIFSEREAAAGTEVVSVGRNESDSMFFGSHDAI